MYASLSSAADRGMRLRPSASMGILQSLRIRRPALLNSADRLDCFSFQCSVEMKLAKLD